MLAFEDSVYSMFKGPCTTRVPSCKMKNPNWLPKYNPYFIFTNHNAVDFQNLLVKFNISLNLRRLVYLSIIMFYTVLKNNKREPRTGVSTKSEAVVSLVSWIMAQNPAHPGMLELDTLKNLFNHLYSYYSLCIYIL